MRRKDSKPPNLFFPVLAVALFVLSMTILIVQKRGGTMERAANEKKSVNSHVTVAKPFKNTVPHQNNYYADIIHDAQQQHIVSEEKRSRGSTADLTETYETLLKNAAIELWGTDEPVITDLPFPGERNPILNDDLENVLLEEGITPEQLSNLGKKAVKALLLGTRFSLKEFLLCIAPYIRMGGEEEVDGVEREQARHIKRLRQLVRTVVQ